LFKDLEILDVLGVGGMGAVYKARQLRLNRLVALKIMICPPGKEADFALRFEREAHVLARLNYLNIVLIYDIGNCPTEVTGSDPLYYLLMEYVKGMHLGQSASEVRRTSQAKGHENDSTPTCQNRSHITFCIKVSL